MARERSIKLVFIVMIAVLFFSFAGGRTVSAASSKVSTWYQSKSGKYYYYNENGKKLKNGRYKIGSKYYYFDSDGVQRTGWQKIKGKYYYFKIAKGKKGYMQTSQKINGIKLQKDGTAKITSFSKRKLPILVKANKKMQSITKVSDTKSQKLKKCYKYVVSNKWLKKSYYLGSFHKEEKYWDLYYGEKVYISPKYISGRVGADCYSYATAFAYLANAIGYKNVKVYATSTKDGHGYCTVGKKAYDPSWEVMVGGVTSYYGRAVGKAGPNGILYGSSRHLSRTI